MSSCNYLTLPHLDFTKEYTIDEFRSDLLTYIDENEFKENRFLFFSSDLFNDYEQHVANVFGYIPADGCTVRLLIELRKSFVLNAEPDFFLHHPKDSIEEIKKYRISWVEKIFPWYKDTNQDYEWLKRFCLPEKYDSASLNHYEYLLKNGDENLDFFENPIDKWIEDFMDFSEKEKTK